MFTAHLSLALRYTNLSSTKAILYKSRQPIEIFSGAIAENPTALQEKRYEATFQYDQFTEPPSSPDGQRPSSSEFVILEQGKKYDLRAIVAVAVRFKAVPAHSGTIARGNHTMTVDVVDWPFFPEDGERLRKRWADLGTLLYEGIETAPFQFTLEATPPLEDCSIGHRVPPTDETHTKRGPHPAGAGSGYIHARFEQSFEITKDDIANRGRPQPTHLPLGALRLRERAGLLLSPPAEAATADGLFSQQSWEPKLVTDRK